MRFTVKNEFKAVGQTFEPGNNHDSTIRDDISDEDVMRWYRAGFVEVEGEAPGPDLNPNHTELAVDNINLGHSVENVNNG